MGREQEKGRKKEKILLLEHLYENCVFFHDPHIVPFFLLDIPSFHDHDSLDDPPSFPFHDPPLKETQNGLENHKKKHSKVHSPSPDLPLSQKNHKKKHSWVPLSLDPPYYLEEYSFDSFSLLSSFPFQPPSLFDLSPMI